MTTEPIELEVAVWYSQIQFVGEPGHGDEEPAWDDGAGGQEIYRFGRNEFMFCVGVAEDAVPCYLTLHLGRSAPEGTELYGQGVIHIGERGLEVANVTESSVEGDMEDTNGVSGTYFPTSWTGRTVIDLVQEGGTRADYEGTEFPERLAVYAYPG